MALELSDKWVLLNATYIIPRISIIITLSVSTIAMNSNTLPCKVLYYMPKFVSMYEPFNVLIHCDNSQIAIKIAISK